MNNTQICNNKFQIFLIIFATFILTISMMKVPHFDGDGHEYYMMSQSFYNHGTPDMQKRDVADANKIDSKFSNSYLKNSESLNDGFGYFFSKKNDLYSYHFFAYSLLSAPIKFILNHFQQNDLKSFQILNTILFIIMIFVVYRRINIDEQKKKILVLFLIFNPILYYLDWTHPEVFTYVFVVLSLMSFNNQNFKTSHVLMAVASWQNPPVIFFSLLVFSFNFFKYLKQKKLQCIFAEGISLSLFILPMVFYYYNYGVLNLIAAKGYSSIAFISFDKILDIYFGLQHGMILFSFLVIGIFSLMVAKKILLKNFYRIDAIFLLSLILISISVTTTPNWNSGMNYVLRYAVWIYPFIVYFVIFQMQSMARLTLIGYANTLIFLIIFCNYTTFSYLHFNRFSEFVLSNFPSLYITTEETFAENMLHAEVDYRSKFPIIYSDEDGRVRKILTDFNGLNKLFSTPAEYVISNDMTSKLQNKYKNESSPFFINFSNNEIVMNMQNIELNQNIAFNSELVEFIHWSNPENTFRWSLDKESSIKFKLNDIKNIKGVLKLNIFTLGIQNMQVFVNDHKIGSKIVELRAPAEIVFEFDIGLIKNGTNVIKFVLPNAHTPNNRDQRVLSMALISFSIE